MKLNELKKVVAEGINNPAYVSYVLVDGKIESGWEYPEDAKEHLMDLPRNKVGKVVSRVALQRMGIDPNNDAAWATRADMMEGVVAERVVPAVDGSDDFIMSIASNELKISAEELQQLCTKVGARMAQKGDGYLIKGSRDAIQHIMDMTSYGDDPHANFMKDRGGVPMDMESGRGSMQSRIAARRAVRPSAAARPVIGSRFETKQTFKDFLLQEMEKHLAKE